MGMMKNKIITSLIVLSFVFSGWTGKASQHKLTRLNVVILMSDDLGSTDLSCYKGPVNTPAIDELAAKGVRFKTFYAGASACSPSRAVLLTGRHHIRAGIYNWVHDQTQNAHLLEREITIADLLKQAGYETVHIGKWRLG